MGESLDLADRAGDRAAPRDRLIGPAAALIALLLTGVLIGCGSGDDQGNAASSGGLPKEIVIGAAIAQTGYLAPYDANVAAIKQLVKETNAQGGIDGRRIRVIEADNRSDPQLAPVATQKVIEGGADVVLSSCEALMAAAAATVAEENDALNFTLCASEPGFGPPHTGRLGFSANRSLVSEAAVRATFAFEKGFTRAFLLRDTSILMGKVDCFGFERTWEDLGGTIAGSADFKNGDESLAGQISELKKSGADVVNICSYPPGGATAIKQIRAAGIEIPITTPSAFDGTFWLKGISSTDDVYATLNGSAYDPTDRATARLFESLERGGVDTDISGALLATYAAGELILEAIEETDSIDGHVLADELEMKPHETIMGMIGYSEKSHLPAGPWFIYEYSTGEPRLVRQVKPQFVPEYEG